MFFFILRDYITGHLRFSSRFFVHSDIVLFLHKHVSQVNIYLKKIKSKEAKQKRSIDSFFVTTKKKKPNKNDDEISVCEVEWQSHCDDTDSVVTLIESCETEPSCSSSITDSTNNAKNSELDENHPTLVQQDMRRFSSLKYE